MKNPIKIFFTFLLCFNINLIGQEYELVWSDEFNADTLDTSKWEFMIGDGASFGLPSGWGNNELQWYTKNNHSFEDGKLIITAKEELVSGKNYSSTRIRTINKGDWKYGRFEFRAKFPIGQGIWPAIWMMPTDNVYGGWAASGEIDIVEYLGHEPNKVHGTIHYGGSWPNNTQSQRSFELSTGNFHDDFHDFALEWEKREIRWYVDGNEYGRLNNWYTAAPFPAPFDQRFHLILNFAVGGNWPGNPDGSTQFPQQFEIDYIRIYQINNPTSVEDYGNLTNKKIYLEQNYPNPFNPTTTITYTLEKECNVRLEVYNTLGQKVQMLVRTKQAPGKYNVIFSPQDLNSGVYLYRLKTDNFVKTREMLFIK